MKRVYSKHITQIEEPFKSIVNEEYQRAKRVLSPLMKGMNRSFIDIRWHEKLRTTGGHCNKYNKVIRLNAKYRDSKELKWNKEMFRMTIRHEIVHLIEYNHGVKFKALLKEIGGHRFVGRPIYTGTGNKNK